MIEIVNLTKQFGRQRVLCGVDLVVRRGYVTGLVGPNGAGKTTLLKIILGLARPNAGTVRVDGNLVSDDPAYRRSVGYMPQIARFPDNLSGRDVLAMLRDLRGGLDASGGPLDEELLDQFQLAGQLDKPLRVLSGGTRQKINAVLAFLFHPALVVLDEPSAGLDPVAVSILKDKILVERARGRTILLSSHILSELDELADDVVVLLDGTIRYAGPVHDLKRTTRQLNVERAIAQVMLQGAA